MLRNPLPTKEQKNDYWRSWHIGNHPEIKTINEIRNFSGEIIMTDDPSHDDVVDPGLPGNIAGSHYYLSQRSLGINDFTDDWMNQIAYSYAIPHLAIRTKTGLVHPTPNTWRPWEYTVMSGLIEEYISLGNGNGVRIKANRNSAIGSIEFIGKIPAITATTFAYITNHDLVPKINNSVTLFIMHNYPNVSNIFEVAVLNVNTDGGLYIQFSPHIYPIGSSVISGQHVFYQLR